MSIITIDPALAVTTVPEIISDRQFFQMLALQGMITEAEALAAVKTGDIPAAFTALLAAIPEAERFGAEMKLSGATEFRRHDPLTLAIGAAQGFTPAQIDALWIEASKL